MTVTGKQGFGASNSRPARVLGHRGMGVGAGENTLEAFAEALRLGADGVELDVRRTADGALAVHHDPVVPGAGAVAELRVRELPAHVPLLEAVLDQCAGALVNIEVKNLPGEPGYDPEELAAREVARLLVDRGRADRVVVSSFSAVTLDAVLDTAAELPAGLLTLPGWDQQASVALAVERGLSALHPHHDAVTADLVAGAHQAGLDVNTWTVDDPERAVWLVSAGVDALITDRVAEIATAVDATGAAR